MSIWYRQELSPFLVFLGMLSNVPMMLSQTFFSMCITSKLWRTSRYLQYSSSKNMDFFFQQLVEVTLDLSCLTFFFPYELQISFIFSSICSPLNGYGGNQNSFSPLNAFFCFLKGWLHGRKCMWPINEFFLLCFNLCE